MNNSSVAESFIVKSETEKTIDHLKKIEQYQTPELVFAFCGPVGSGISKVAKITERIMKSYNYKTHYIKITDLLIKRLEKINSGYEAFINNLKDTDQGKYINEMQDQGNEIRKDFNYDILARLAVQEITIKRLSDSGSRNPEEMMEKLRPRRHLTIIDSLKHPKEVELLRLAYGNMFYLFGVLCPETKREHRLIYDKHISKPDAVSIMDRDKLESEKYGQRIIKTLYSADFFVRNYNNATETKNSIKRFTELVLGSNVYTPTVDEYAMFIAQSTALRSGCLSRQVGAAIISEKGELISTGRNDVPKYGGGLYVENDDHDNRCLNFGAKECKNEHYTKEMLKKINMAVSDNLTKNLSDAIESGAIEQEIMNKITDGFSEDLSKIERLKD